MPTDTPAGAPDAPESSGCPGNLVGVTINPPRPSAPPPGLAVDGYELRARLGEGGMGVVHLAQRPGQRPVALKVLRPNVVGDDEARRRLAREVDSLSRVRSRRVAEIIDADPWGSVPYVATRYVPGLTLHDHVREEGALEGDDLLWFADCLAEALQAVHAVGVLHRDIKPSNVIMEGRTPILIDFGLARVADDAKVTQTGWLLGTPGYLAPEILFGEDACEASDVHSWAATVAFAAQGRAPFGRGPSIAVMDRVRRGEHDLDDVVDDDLFELLEAALAPEPDERPDLAEVRDWIEEIRNPRPAPRRGLFGRRAPDSVPMTAPYSQPDAPDHAPAVPPTMVDDRTQVADQDDELATDRLDDRDPRAYAPEPVSAPVPTRRHLDDDRTWVVPDEHHDEGDADEEWSGWTEVAPQRAQGGAAFGLRRTLLVLASGAVLVGAAAAAPWLTLAGSSLLVWVLRAGSLSTSAMRRRRDVRGSKWFDGVLGTLGAPWHLVAALPGAFLLLLWSLGMAAAAALLSYALALGPTTTLALVGATYAGGLWWGPGSGRFKGPVDLAVRAGASRPVPGLLLAVLVTACATGLLAYAQEQGTNWAPAEDAPFSQVSTPGWL